MKYVLILSCLLLVGCSPSSPTNVVGDANQAALDEYQKALAEADRMAESDKDFKN